MLFCSDRERVLEIKVFGALRTDAIRREVVENSLAVTHSVCFGELELVFPALRAAAFSADESQEGAQLTGPVVMSEQPSSWAEQLYGAFVLEWHFEKCCGLDCKMEIETAGFYMPGNQGAHIYY